MLPLYPEPRQAGHLRLGTGNENSHFKMHTVQLTDYLKTGQKIFDSVKPDKLI